MCICKMMGKQAKEHVSAKEMVIYLTSDVEKCSLILHAGQK